MPKPNANRNQRKRYTNLPVTKKHYVYYLQNEFILHTCLLADVTTYCDVEFIFQKSGKQKRPSDVCGTVVKLRRWFCRDERAGAFARDTFGRLGRRDMSS